MKKILLILLFLPAFSFAQRYFYMRGDTLFLRMGADSIKINFALSQSAPVVWGDVSGNLADQQDLNTAFGLKLDAATAASSYQPVLGFTPVPNTTTVNGNALSSNILTPYTINVQALTSSPADAGTTYFGMLPKAPTTTANTSKVYIRTAGTITAAEIYCYSGTAGTNESWSLYIRRNNTTDFLIATVSTSVSERVFSNTGLSIAVSAGDYIEIKSIQPTWATNPLTTIYGGYIKLN